MAVPFRRSSSKRVKERRGPKNFNFRTESNSSQPKIKCSNCMNLKISHFICSNCYFYKGINFNKRNK